MKLKNITQYGFTILIIGSSLSAFAAVKQTDEEPPATELIIQADNKIFVPDSEIVKNEKDFNFDWNNSATIQANKNKPTKIEALLKKTHPSSMLSKADQQALSKLLYKLGTYYTHIAHEPDLAIAKLDLANALSSNTEDKAWNNDHLAYAYEQKYAESRLAADREKSLYYSNNVISELYPNTKNKEVAFAYFVKGLVQNDTLDYTQAELSFKNALGIYETLPNGKDDQYARTISRLASTLSSENGRENEAITLFNQSKEYWQTKTNNNPSAATNLISLGQVYLKLGKAKDALEAVEKAIPIYQTVYGKNNIILQQPYQLLANAYKLLGDENKALSYEEKVRALQ